MSRIGRGHPTGIDRVEHAYIHAVAQRDQHALALAKLGKDFVVAPLAEVSRALPNLLAGRLKQGPTLRDRFRFRLPAAQRSARGFLRRCAMGQGKRVGAALGGAAPEVYLNVGHTNLDADSLQTIRDHGAETWVMVHDLIPLEFPQYTRPGVTEQFRKRMRAVAANADRIICNSAATQASVRACFAEWGPVPQTMVAHLGVEPLAVERQTADPPYFVVLGTIEPRKNHQVLLDAWQMLPDPKPELRIIGRRGWMNETVFARLDEGADGITEVSDADDADLAKHLAGAKALLFPSHAEGYGLPALEAAQAGLPIICSDLPVFRELLGSGAIYLDPNQPEVWAKAIAAVAQSIGDGQDDHQTATAAPEIPTWDSHFRHVFHQD